MVVTWLILGLNWQKVIKVSIQGFSDRNIMKHRVAARCSGLMGFELQSGLCLTNVGPLGCGAVAPG